MTVLSLMGAGGEASLWPHCRRELEAESLLRRRAETPLSCSSPQGQGTCWPWQMGGQYCTSSLGGVPTPQQGKVLGECVKLGVGSVEGALLKALCPISSSAGGPQFLAGPDWTRRSVTNCPGLPSSEGGSLELSVLRFR